MIAAIAAIAAAVTALVEALAAAVAVWALLELIFDPKGKQKVGYLLANIVGGGLSVIGTLVTDLESPLVDVAHTVMKAVTAKGPPIAKAFRDPAAKLAKDAFTDAEKAMLSVRPSVPGEAVEAASKAMGNAFGFGLASAGVTAAFEALLPEKLNTFNAAGPMFAQLAGFSEVARAVLGPLYENAFGRSLRYHYAAEFKPDLPSEGDAVLWHSRRLLDDEALRKVFSFSGLKPEYEIPFIESAFRAIQPRSIASAIQDVPFPTADMRSMLEFYGARDRDIALVLRVFRLASTRNVRNALLAKLIAVTSRGAIDDLTLDNHLDSLEFSDEAKHFVHLTVALERLEQLQELYRKSVSVGYKFGEIADADYVRLLEAAGIRTADAEAHYAIDSEAARGKALQRSERAEAALERREMALSVAAAREAFVTHQSNLVEFEAALVLAGLPARLIPPLTALAVATREAKLKVVFGQRLTPEKAELLRAKVTAVEEQVTKKLMPLPAARDTLKSFDLGDDEIEALLAAWAAKSLKQVLAP